MGWVDVDGAENLPSGEWVVRLESGRNEIARTTGKDGSVFIVGGCFHFDMPKVIAYTRVPFRYGDKR